jgi:hypothetical protein
MSGKILNRVVTDKLLLYVDGANSDCYVTPNSTLNDLVSNDPGLLINGVAYDTNNYGSFVFDGGDDYIDLGNRVTNLAPSYPLSIDCWIWVSSTNTFGGGVFSTNGTPPIYYGFGVQIFSNFIFANIGNGTGGGSGNRRSYSTSTALVPEVWNHVVVTVDTGNVFQFYLNGVLRSGSYSGSGGSINWGSGTTTQIGRATGYLQQFKGKVSNVKLYNKLLSQSEVLQNYNALKNRFI